MNFMFLGCTAKLITTSHSYYTYMFVLVLTKKMWLQSVIILSEASKAFIIIAFHCRLAYYASL